MPSIKLDVHSKYLSLINLIMRKIALPLLENKLSPHFGHCQNFIIYDIHNKNIVSQNLLASPPHQPGLLPGWLINQHITDLIVGGIGHKAIEIFSQHKINVFVGAKVKEPIALIHDYLNGTLETNGNLCNH